MSKTIRENPVLLCILLFLLALAGPARPALSVLCVSFFWLLRTKDRSVLLILAACAVILMPRWNESRVSMKEGTAVIVNGSYSVLQNHRNRVLVYTDEPLVYDGIYTINGRTQKLRSSESFFGFDSAYWFRSLGVRYSVNKDQIHLQERKPSFRACLQKQIEKTDDEKQKSMLYRTLLNIRLKTASEDDWMYDNGFSFAGILAVLNLVLKYLLDWKKRRKVMAVLSLLLSFLYRFPLLTVQAFLFHLLSLTDMDAYERTGIGLSLIICMYPFQVKSMSFLIPAVYRLCSLHPKKGRVLSFNIILMIQSLLMNSMNPIRNLCYGIFQKICGLLWFAGISALFTSGHLFSFLSETASDLDAFLDHFDLPGSILSITLPFFLLCLWCLRKKENASWLICIFLLVFQITGWMHPFGELTFISVGQGDAILLRAPFNSTNILIDTGKPSAWNAVDTMLKAKSIHHLDGLIITHGDNDHAGNRDQVIMHYQPEKIIETHQKETTIGPFVFHDLNEIRSEDENESSIADVVGMNHMNVCLMGDATENTEKVISEQYDRLHCDVLKLGHHGSKTSSSDLFLDTVRPDIGIISSGPYSIYHHPSPETIQKLLKRHIPYFDTKEEGDITILFFPHCNLLVTASGKIAIIP